MSAPEKLRSIIVALLLGPCLAAAADIEAAASNEQPIPSQLTAEMKPEMVPPVLMWPPMMPVARPMVYYWAPPPGMVWPVMPQYPAHVTMPSVVWVMVPVPATSLSPAMVDYGPVADTPVVELPQTDPDTAQAVAEDAALAAALAQEGKVDAGPAEGASGVESATLNGQSPAAGEPAAPAIAVPVNEAPVDYGPVSPTPVVDLLTLESLASKTPDASRPPPKPARKSGTPASPKPVAKAKSEPSKRLCWTKGVVAPCR